MAFYKGRDSNTVLNPLPQVIHDHFTVPSGTNMSTTPVRIATELTHNTAISVIWIYANVAPAGATKFRVAVCAKNGRSNIPGPQLLANLAIGDITINGVGDSPDNVDLGNNIGLPLGKILGKSPAVLPWSFDLFLYGDASLTNTVTFHAYVDYCQDAFFYIDDTFRTSSIETLTPAV